jgi:uncharacterized SAM-binding protein YcdF (DUF218 family)
MLTAIKNTLVSVLVPPMGLAVLALVGLAMLRARPRAGRALIAAGVAGLLLFGTPAFSDLLMIGLENNLPLTPPPGDPPQAIVVLGAEITRVPDVLYGAEVGRLTLDRLRTAAALQRRTGLPVLVTGGTTQIDTPAVGVLMTDSMGQDFGIPVSWTEARSRDTWENAAFSAEILLPLGIHSVYVVTHAWHMRRAVMAFSHTGLVMTAAPTARVNRTAPIASDFVPRVSAWQSTWYAMHEWIGCAWYAIR